MNDKTKLAIWKTFLDLLPKDIPKSHRAEIANTIEKAGSYGKATYDAAAYAGWCRGYAEGDGVHRVDSETPKRLEELRKMSGYAERQDKAESLRYMGRPIEDMTQKELIEVCYLLKIEVCYLLKAEADLEHKRHMSTLKLASSVSLYKSKNTR